MKKSLYFCYFFLFEARSHRVVQVSLNLVIFLLQLPKYCDCKSELPGLAAFQHLGDMYKLCGPCVFKSNNYRLVSAYVGPGIHTFCWLLPYIQWIHLGKYFSVVKEAEVVWTRIYLCLNAYEQRLVFALDVS